MRPPEPERRAPGTTPDYTDPSVPGAAPDDERPEVDPEDAAAAGDTRPPDEADPDSPDDDGWEGETLTSPGPG